MFLLLMNGKGKENFWSINSLLLVDLGLARGHKMRWAWKDQSKAPLHSTMSVLRSSYELVHITKTKATSHVSVMRPAWARSTMSSDTQKKKRHGFTQVNDGPACRASIQNDRGTKREAGARFWADERTLLDLISWRRLLPSLLRVTYQLSVWMNCFCFMFRVGFNPSQI